MAITSFLTETIAFRWQRKILISRIQPWGGHHAPVAAARYTTGDLTLTPTPPADPVNPTIRAKHQRPWRDSRTFFRWGNAHMLLALADLISTTGPHPLSSSSP